MGGLVDGWVGGMGEWVDGWIDTCMHENLAYSSPSNHM